jgi:hypothetical protein
VEAIVVCGVDSETVSCIQKDVESAGTKSVGVCPSVAYGMSVTASIMDSLLAAETDELRVSGTPTTSIN